MYISSCVLFHIPVVNMFVDLPQCDKEACSGNGECFDKPDGSKVCSCTAGFTGADCSTNNNECNAWNPCRHNGVCVDGIDGITCTCQTGWAGTHCETGEYQLYYIQIYTNIG